MPLSPGQFRAKGHGKTAPWVDLVNSEEWDTYGERRDWLDDPSWLPFFLEQWQFAAPAGRPFPAAKFRALRRALRMACEAISAGSKIPPNALQALNTALNLTGRHQMLQLQHAMRLEFVPSMKGWDWVLAQSALSFARLLAGSDSSRIKICLNPDCRWIFYDTTKARIRRWCSDKVCGNRDRVRRARARRAS
jgi:predicted RNA-binding Zn ribbon-like protein